MLKPAAKLSVSSRHMREVKHLELPVQGQLALPADVQAKLKAAQQMAAKLGMQHLPQQTSQPTTQDTMRLIATAQAIASNIAQQVGALCNAVQC